jgi:hypothetical protein
MSDSEQTPAPSPQPRPNVNDTMQWIQHGQTPSSVETRPAQSPNVEKRG